MTESEYSRLASACDAVLCAPGLDAARVAVPWLHVLNEHPSNLRRYTWLFRGACGENSATSRIRNRIGIGRTLARSVLRPQSLADSERSMPGRVDVLLLSHLVSGCVKPEDPDFYFGDLGHELARAGVTSLLALQDHLQDPGASLAETLRRGGHTARLVLPRWSTPVEEVRLLNNARHAAAGLKAQHRNAATPLVAAIAREASSQALTASTLSSLRLHMFVRQLCERFRPRAIIALWEGHAWERLAFHAARLVDPAINCIGYQHTILFPRSHAVKRAIAPAYDPDVLLTLGDVTRELLVTSKGLGATPVVTFGSHRCIPGSALRCGDTLRRCLVVPDGIEIECVTLFDFAIDAARRLPDIEFVLRTHPVLPFSMLAERDVRYRQLPRNVHVSTASQIGEDFARCAWALYRGSSAAVHAVLAGMRPLYLQRAEELQIDPLFAMAGWRKHIRSREDFSRVVRLDQESDDASRQREWECHRAFCDRYVVPRNAAVLPPLIGMAVH